MIEEIKIEKILLFRSFEQSSFMDVFCQKTEGQMHMINMISSGVNQILPLSTDLTTDLLPAHL